MTGIGTRLRTAWALGPFNILRVASYRAGLKSGLHPVQRLGEPPVPRGPYFMPPSLPCVDAAPAPSWARSVELFGHLELPPFEGPPDWHLSAANGKRANATSNWWEISDFEADLGDIKPVWEVSRMAWALPFAQNARNGDRKSLMLLNSWIADWLAHNPTYKGVNWKCGQEASIRVMHLAMAAHLLGQLQAPTPSLRTMVEIHLRRIAPTVSYAMAQDNNHGTSEAVALYVGGALLGDQGISWRKRGEEMLHERVARLVLPDGSFSQQSLVYHRLFLDSLSMAEIVRRAFRLPQFPPRLMDRCKSAVVWMQAMIDNSSGDGVNLGANDGAQLLPLTALPSRDFRPSLQLSAALFAGYRAIEADGLWDDALLWLGVEKPVQTQAAPESLVADEGGFAVLRKGSAVALLRYPRFRFRPSHADAMHVDLWVGGTNWLPDSGSYSYNTDASLMSYFNGTESHNTVQFDGRNQMPQLGRFLFGDWLETEAAGLSEQREDSVSFAASYRDRHGARHQRTLTLGKRSLTVNDEVSGFASQATLRWHLQDSEWLIERPDAQTVLLRTAHRADFRLIINSSTAIRRAEVTKAWRSLHYLKKQMAPVLEVEINDAASLTTLAEWSA